MPEWMAWVFLLLAIGIFWKLRTIVQQLDVISEWLHMIWKNQNTHHTFRMNTNSRSDILRMRHILDTWQKKKEEEEAP